MSYGIVASTRRIVSSGPSKLDPLSRSSKAIKKIILLPKSSRVHNRLDKLITLTFSFDDLQKHCAIFLARAKIGLDIYSKKKHALMTLLSKHICHEAAFELRNEEINLKQF